MHGTRNVNDKNELSWRDILGPDLLGRLGHEQKEIFLLARIEHQAGLDLPSGQPVMEDKVPVSGKKPLPFQLQGGRGFVFPLDIDVVAGADDLL